MYGSKANTKTMGAWLCQLLNQTLVRTIAAAATGSLTRYALNAARPTFDRGKCFYFCSFISLLQIVEQLH